MRQPLGHPTHQPGLRVAVVALTLLLGGTLSACDQCGGAWYKMRTAIAAAPVAAATSNWSDPATWGGTVPAAGAQVHIPAGTTVLLDVNPPPLASLMIEGALVATERDTLLNVGWIMVSGSGSRLEIGTEATPFAHRFEILLTGQVVERDASGAVVMMTVNNGDNPNRQDPKPYDVMGMHMGGRFLVARSGGAIEIHGASQAKTPWTHLNATVAAGAGSITVAEASGWAVGDKIGIAPSGFLPEQREVRTITAISGTTVTLDTPLAYAHFGQRQTFAGRTVETRAEVALLSRNVVIHGDPSVVSTDTAAQRAFIARLGGHVMFMTGSTVHIAGVELYNMGQVGRQARYPIHWHIAGDHHGDYVRNCAVHDSFHRAYVVHSTSGVELTGNVAYNIASHTYVTEMGDEEEVRFVNNLAIGTFTLPPELRAFGAIDSNLAAFPIQSEWRAACFWIANVNNVLQGNVAAGCSYGHGFFFDKAPNGRPHEIAGLPPSFMVLRDNVAHSILGYVGGSDRYPPLTTGSGFFIDGVSSQSPADKVFERCVAYKCAVGGFWIEQMDHVLKDCTTVDCHNGVSSLNGAKITNLIAVGQSANTINDGTGDDGIGPIHLQPDWVGITDADHAGDGSDLQLDGFVGINLTVGMTFFTLLPTVRVAHVSMNNGAPAIYFQPQTRGSLFDADGSASGTGVPTIISTTPPGAGALTILPSLNFPADATPPPLYLVRLTGTGTPARRVRFSVERNGVVAQGTAAMVVLEAPVRTLSGAGPLSFTDVPQHMPVGFRQLTATWPASIAKLFPLHPAVLP